MAADRASAYVLPIDHAASSITSMSRGSQRAWIARYRPAPPPGQDHDGGRVRAVTPLDVWGGQVLCCGQDPLRTTAWRRVRATLAVAMNDRGRLRRLVARTEVEAEQRYMQAVVNEVFAKPNRAPTRSAGTILESATRRTLRNPPGGNAQEAARASASPSHGFITGRLNRDSHDSSGSETRVRPATTRRVAAALVQIEGALESEPLTRRGGR